MSTFERIGFEDQLNIETPEQVDLRFNVAGIGSRFVALLLDMLAIFAVYLIEFFGVLALASSAPRIGGAANLDTAGKWFIAVLIFFQFLLYWGYFALFEAFWHGQTLGKRVMKLRVIKDSGRQITFFEALARNLLRIIDYLPVLYLVGVITMLCNKRNKRLGDFAAGTLVIHERMDEQPLLYQTSTTILPPTVLSTPTPWQQGVPALFPADAIARLSTQDLLIIDTFFARMLDLPMETRAAMAYRISGQMAAKMGQPLPEGNPERVLESIAYQMRSGGRGF
jgi:uncharacterized RDD family membrane protein YckC